MENLNIITNHYDIILYTYIIIKQKINVKV